MADTEIPRVTRTLTEGAVRRSAGQELEPEERDERRRRAAQRALAARQRQKRESEAQGEPEAPPDESDDSKGKLVNVRA